MVEQPKIGGNMTTLQKKIAAGVAKVEDLKAERKTINADIQTVIEDMEANGIPRDAFKAAMAYKTLDQVQREAYTIGYDISREAIGLPVQQEMGLDAAPPEPAPPPANETPRERRNRVRREKRAAEKDAKSERTFLGDTKSGKKPPPGYPRSVTHVAGFEAHGNDLAKTDNPHPVGTTAAAEWLAGWEEANESSGD